jgi:hypothetical protein
MAKEARYRFWRQESSAGAFWYLRNLTLFAYNAKNELPVA